MGKGDTRGWRGGKAGLTSSMMTTRCCGRRHTGARGQTVREWRRGTQSANKGDGREEGREEGRRLTSRVDVSTVMTFMSVASAVQATEGAEVS